MINAPLVVPKLIVQVVTGDTCYASEGGFSSISAEVTPEDPKLIEQLSLVQKSRHDFQQFQFGPITLLGKA